MRKMLEWAGLACERVQGGIRVPRGCVATKLPDLDRCGLRPPIVRLWCQWKYNTSWAPSGGQQATGSELRRAKSGPRIAGNGQRGSVSAMSVEEVKR